MFGETQGARAHWVSAQEKLETKAERPSGAPNGRYNHGV
jgi:hypothetical protein